MKGGAAVPRKWQVSDKTGMELNQVSAVKPHSMYT